MRGTMGGNRLLRWELINVFIEQVLSRFRDCRARGVEEPCKVGFPLLGLPPEATTLIYACAAHALIGHPFVHACYGVIECTNTPHPENTGGQANTSTPPLT